jgi:hypothetical protein
MEQSNTNKKDNGTRLSKKWIFTLGLIIVFGVEFVSRDFILPANASDINVGLALVGEWARAP